MLSFLGLKPVIGAQAAEVLVKRVPIACPKIVKPGRVRIAVTVRHSSAIGRIVGAVNFANCYRFGGALKRAELTNGRHRIKAFSAEDTKLIEPIRNKSSDRWIERAHLRLISKTPPLGRTNPGQR